MYTVYSNHKLNATAGDAAETDTNTYRKEYFKSLTRITFIGMKDSLKN